MDTAWTWELSGHCAKYSFLTDPKGLTMREVEHIFQLAPEPPSEAVKADLFSGRRFLIAEDNAINAEIISELLRMCGAQIEVKGDGALAVEAFRAAAPGTYDAILMDIQMPLMNGYEAAEALRSMEREDAQNVPIIAMTANAFADDVLAAKNAGMNEHIAKPLDMLRLQELLGDYLNR